MKGVELRINQFRSSIARKYSQEMTLEKNVQIWYNFLKLGFTPCKTEQPLRGMELKEKEAQKD